MISPDVTEPMRSLLVSAGLDTLNGAFALSMGRELNKPNLGSRRRTRLELTDSAGRLHVVYLKRYGPEPLKARVRRLMENAVPIGPALVEAGNITTAARLGVTQMRALAWGQTGQRGYLVIAESPGESLERIGAGERGKSWGDGFRLASLLSSLAWRLHGAGYVHRDFYACHVFLHKGQVSLIDLARMFKPRWFNRRWRVKDLAQLHYSMGEYLSSEHWSRLVKDYASSSGDEPRRLARSIERKSARIRRGVDRRRRRASQ